MSTQYDAVVIGAGHNGLTCACYLAKAGLSVLVVEANDTIGGLTTTQEITRPGFHSDLHAFGYQFASLSSVPDELGLWDLGLELIEPEVSFAHAFPDGGTVRMHRSLDATCESIATYSASDADRWRVLFERWLDAKDGVRAGLNSVPGPPSSHLAALEGSAAGLDEYRFETQTLRSWVHEWFDDDHIRLFLGAFSLHANTAPDETGGGHLAWLFDSIIQDYGNRPVKGGMGQVPRALARCLDDLGGEIRTGARVREIVVADGAATGVRLDDGETIGVGRAVASSVDPRALVSMLGRDAVGDEVADDVDRYEWGDSIMVIYLALDEPLRFNAGGDTDRACYVHCTPPSLEYVTQMFAEARAGLLPAGPVCVVCNDSAVDPARAPAGKGVAKILVKCVPYELRGDARGVVSGRRWDDVKEPYADHVVELLDATYVPNLASSILERVVHSPVDQERLISSAVRGTELQGAFVPYQTGSLRPVPGLGAYRSPVPNVFLCGSSSHPGPGVSFMPGRNAAAVIAATSS